MSLRAPPLSEREFDSELHATAVAACNILPEPLIHLPSGSVEARYRVNARSRSIRTAELRVVERVVRFEAELEGLSSFVPFEILHQREVPVIDARPSKCVLRRVPAPEIRRIRGAHRRDVECLKRSTLVFRKDRASCDVGPHSGRSRCPGGVYAESAAASDVRRRYERVRESHRLAAQKRRHAG